MQTTGKLPPAVLERLVLAPLRQLSTRPECQGAAARVAVGASVGEDAAILRVPQAGAGTDALVVVGADPITGADNPHMAGALAVYINANDVLVQGGQPQWMTITLLVPVGTTEEDLASVVSGICEASARLGLVVVGGHTEVTDAVQKIVVCGTLLGPLHPCLQGRMISTGGLSTGDKLLLTKSVGLEGTGILLVDRGDQLVADGVFASAEALEAARAAHPLEEVSVHLEVAALVNSIAPYISSMHDPTEGGVANAMHEMVSAASSNSIVLRISRMALPIAEDTAAICRYFKVDPLTLISSGCLLAAVHPDHADSALAAVRGAGIACALIGEVVPARFDPAESGEHAVSKVAYDDNDEEIKQPDQDALWAILASS